MIMTIEILIIKAPDEGWHRVDTLLVRVLQACHAQYNAPGHRDDDDDA